MVANAALLVACGGPPQPLDFTELSSPTGRGSMTPHLAVTANDIAVMSWMEPAAGDSHALRYATLQPGGWSAPRPVADGGNWFVNRADFPSVVPISVEHWAAHWLVKRPGGTYAYDCCQTDVAMTGSDPIIAYRDRSPVPRRGVPDTDA